MKRSSEFLAIGDPFDIIRVFFEIANTVWKVKPMLHFQTNQPWMWDEGRIFLSRLDLNESPTNARNDA
jgi:hypothetical protein